MQRQRFSKHCKQNFKPHAETFNIKSNGLNPIGVSIHTLVDNPNAHFCNVLQTPLKPLNLHFIRRVMYLYGNFHKIHCRLFLKSYGENHKGRCVWSSSPRWHLVQNRCTSPQRSDPRHHLTHDSLNLILHTPLCRTPYGFPIENTRFW